MGNGKQLQRSLALAHIFRELRNRELVDARQMRDAALRCELDQSRRVFVDQCKAMVRAADLWQHQLIVQQRKIRDALIVRRVQQIADRRGVLAARVERSQGEGLCQ